MRGKVIAYLQLIRMPNVLTAAADSLSGWLLATGSVSEPLRWLPLIVASMVLYASGTALNDVFDLDEDRRDRPGRPLPSGRASTRVAAWLGGLGLVIGPLIALASGSVAGGVVAAILAGCILAYDAGMKRTPIGPVFMGSCRGLNLLLGLSHANDLGGPVAWVAVSAYGLYVAGITVVSRSETSGENRRGLIVGVTLQNLALLVLAGGAMAHQRFPTPTPHRPLLPLEGLLVFALVAMTLNLAASAAIRQPTPGAFQKAVKTGILSLVWLNVGLVAAVRGIEPAAMVAAFWFPAFVLGRWLYST
ncbi:MAG: UbiA family prenyltransferase [Isosphaeraceae bacterium]